jgi:hypothetical protein
LANCARLLVSALGNGNALHTHGVACSVHHDEHVLQATVFLAHQVAHRTAVVTKLQHGCGAGLDAHLVFDAHAEHVVAGTQGTVCIHHEFGHDKQADALHALGRALHTGQHQMDDVLGHVVLTVGDEDLGAENFVGAVGLWLGAGAHGCQVGAGLGLGQVHGAGPLAAHQLFQVGGFQLVGACGQQASMAPSVSSGHSAKLMLALLIISPQAAPMVWANPGRQIRPGVANPASHLRQTV